MSDIEVMTWENHERARSRELGERWAYLKRLKERREKARKDGMERLTNKREADAQREEYERRLANGYPRNIPEERFLRLAAYEDTGWTPEMLHKLGENAGHMWDFAQAAENMTVGRLKELAEADKDRRVVVLPCKVGDVVYGFHNNRQTILPMVAKWIETNADGWCTAVQYTPMAPRFYRFSDFGKTVFLSREEAEKALEARKDG